MFGSNKTKKGELLYDKLKKKHRKCISIARNSNETLNLLLFNCASHEVYIEN